MFALNIYYFPRGYGKINMCLNVYRTNNLSVPLHIVGDGVRDVPFNSLWLIRTIIHRKFM